MKTTKMDKCELPYIVIVYACIHPELTEQLEL